MANSKVLVKNDKVIVTEWSFDIGDSTGHHIHQYNYVVVPMLDGELKIIDKNTFWVTSEDEGIGNPFMYKLKVK